MLMALRVMDADEMKHIDMKQRRDRPIAVRRPDDRKVDGAFDLWLTRGLHELFDDVAREPIPDSLLKLIEDDRAK